MLLYQTCRVQGVVSFQVLMAAFQQMQGLFPKPVKSILVKSHFFSTISKMDLTGFGSKPFKYVLINSVPSIINKST